MNNDAIVFILGIMTGLCYFGVLIEFNLIIYPILISIIGVIIFALEIDNKNLAREYSIYTICKNCHNNNTIYIKKGKSIKKALNKAECKICALKELECEKE